MEKKYLEFWGNYFLSAARNQEIYEELASMSERGLELAETQMTIFRKFYGLEDSDKEDFDRSDWWQKSFREFRRSYRDFMELLGVVPKEDYDELALKYEALKKVLEEKEEKGKYSMQGATGYDQDDVVKGVKDLLKTQTEQFHELMNVFGEIYAGSQKRGKSKK